MPGEGWLYSTILTKRAFSTRSSTALASGVVLGMVLAAAGGQLWTGPEPLEPPVRPSDHAAHAPMASPPSEIAPRPLAAGGAPPSIAGRAPGFLQAPGEWQGEKYAFTARSGSLTVHFGRGTVVFVQSGSDRAVTVRFPGGNMVDPEGAGKLGATTNVFRGNDPAKWQRDLASFEHVRFTGIFDGVDLVYSLGLAGLKYEFHLQAGVDPAKVRVAYEGALSLRIDDEGALVVAVGTQELRDSPPVALQNGRPNLACAFELAGLDTLSFACDGVDRALPLTIDPLVFGTYFGGSARDEAWSVAVDPAGNTYASGITYSSDFPVTPGSFDSGFQGTTDAWVAKFNATASAPDWVTLLGGRYDEGGYAIAVDAAGQAFVVGETNSFDFPTTPGAYSTTYGATPSVFLTKLNAAGDALVFSTFLGGAFIPGANTLAIDRQGGAYLVGAAGSGEIPFDPNAFDNTENGQDDAFVLKVNASGASIDYATYLGSSEYDRANAVVVGGDGTAYVAGSTQGYGFPTTVGALNTTGAPVDGFVARVAANGSALVFSTLIGGSGDDGVLSMDLRSDGKIVVSGGSTSDDLLGGATNCSGPKPGPARASFVALLTGDGAGAEFCMFFGGAGPGYYRNWVATLPDNRLAVSGFSGYTDSFLFTADAVDTTFNGSDEAFIARIDTAGGGILYSSLLGGDGLDEVIDLAVDRAGIVHAVGWTNSTDLPVRGAGVDRSLGGSYDAFLWKFNFSALQVRIDSNPPNLTLSVDSLPQAASKTVWCSLNDSFAVDAPAVQGNDSVRYVFSNWTDGGARNHTVLCDGSKNITARYETRYNLTLRTDPPGLDLSVDGVVFQTPTHVWCLAGAVALLDALSPQIVGSTQFALANWSDGGAASHGVVCGAPSNLTASFARAFLVEIYTDPCCLDITVDGAAQPSPLSLWWAAGSSHLVGADSTQAESGGIRYAFAGWSDRLTQNHSVTALAPTMLLASFDPEYLVTVTTEPPGRALAVDGVQTGSANTSWWRGGWLHTLSAQSPQAVGDVEYRFLAWSDGGSASHLAVASGPSTFVARFATFYRTAILSAPANVSIMVDGVTAVAQHEDWWENGSSHTLEASDADGPPGTRYRFESWSDGLAASHVVVARGPVTFSATYRVEHLVTLSLSAEGAVVRVDGVARNGSTSFWWSAGSSHDLSADASTTVGRERFIFKSWAGGSQADLHLSIDGPVSLSALFTRQFEVTIATHPSNLRIAVDGEELESPLQLWWDAFKTYSLYVPDPQGSNSTTRRFLSWSDGGSKDRLFNVNGPLDLVATFETAHRVLITTSPDGIGIRVDGVLVPRSATFWWLENSNHTIDARSTGALFGNSYAFLRWSDGEAPLNRTFVATGPATLEAVYAAGPTESPLGGTVVWVLLIAAVVGVAYVVVRSRRQRPNP